MISLVPFSPGIVSGLLPFGCSKSFSNLTSSDSISSTRTVGLVPIVITSVLGSVLFSIGVLGVGVPLIGDTLYEVVVTIFPSSPGVFTFRVLTSRLSSFSYIVL